MNASPSLNAANIPFEPEREELTTNGFSMASQDLSALTTLAKPGAIAVYRYVADHPGSYYGDIVAGTDVASATVSRYLLDLEANGLISGDIPSHARRGRSIRYSVEPGRLDDLLQRVRDAIHGDPDA